MTRRQAPVLMHHRRTEPSQEPEAATQSSGLMVTHATGHCVPLEHHLLDLLLQIPND